MKVIIPCAGRGTRRYPESKGVPKVLLDFQGHPILEHIIESILSIHPNPHLIFVLNLDLGDQVIAYMRRYSELKVSYCYQFKPKGFGHAVLQAKDLAGREPVLVHACDKVLDFDELDTFDVSFSWMAVKAINPPLGRSVLKVDGGYVTEMIEKPDMSWNAVCYIRESNQLFDTLETMVEYDRRTASEIQITDALRSLVGQGVRMRAVHFPTLYTESGVNTECADYMDTEWKRKYGGN